MNTWQATRLIKQLLTDLRWEQEPSNDVVFSNVFITAAVANADIFLSEARFPFAIIRPLDGTTDESEQAIVIQSWEVVILQAVDGDEVGDRALIGANRTGVGGSESFGRGLLEIESQVIRELGRLDRNIGFSMSLRDRSRGQAAVVDGIGYVAEMSLVFEGIIEPIGDVPIITRMRATDVGGGDVDLTWRNPFQRYDLREVKLVRKDGSSAPTTELDGTDIPLSGLLVESHTDSPGTGTFTYRVFTGVDPFEFGQSIQFGGADPSDPQTIRTAKTVTVA